MSFKTYLLENTTSKYRTPIDKDTAIELIKKNCKNAVLDKPLFRGTNVLEPYQLVQGENSYRKPKTGKGYYNVLIDHFIDVDNSKFPKRSASIICISNAGKTYAKGFGKLYVVLPYDTTLIAECPENDIWDVQVDNLTFDQFNDELLFNDVSNDTFEDIVDGIVEILKENKSKALKHFFESKSDKESIIKKLHSEFSVTNNKYIGFKLIKNKDIPTDTENELWIGGKCVMIEYDEYFDEILPLIKKD